MLWTVLRSECSRTKGARVLKVYFIVTWLNCYFMGVACRFWLMIMYLFPVYCIDPQQNHGGNKFSLYEFVRHLEWSGPDKGFVKLYFNLSCIGIMVRYTDERVSHFKSAKPVLWPKIRI